MRLIIKAINKILKETRYIKYRRKLTNKNFTIISQNCIGGVIYHQLGMDFKSPTINMFLEDDNFIKLVYNFRHYMGINPEPLLECYVDPLDDNVRYPKIKIEDIEICCLHYKNCKDAIDAWNRRRKRVNFDNIYVIANSWNLHNDIDNIKKIAMCPYKTVVFSTIDVPFDNVILLNGEGWKLDSRNILRPNLTDDVPGKSYKYFEKLFDYVSWLNGS